jgi:NhaA family Na+:H+ antiporter
MSEQSEGLHLLRPINRDVDHLRGGEDSSTSVRVLMYGDYLCPYCRRLRPVLGQLRGLMGDRMIYAFRHFPNERAHPGATFAGRCMMRSMKPSPL